MTEAELARMVHTMWRIATGRTTAEEMAALIAADMRERDTAARRVRLKAV